MKEIFFLHSTKELIFYLTKDIYFKIYPNKIFQPKIIHFLLESGIQMNLRKDLIYNRSLIFILSDESPFFKIIIFN